MARLSADRKARDAGGSRRTGLSLLAAATLVLGCAAGLEAQEEIDLPDGGTVALEGTGGLSIPVATFDELTKSGAALGGGVSVHLTRQVSVHLRADRHLLEGIADTLGNEFPDMEAVHATGGVQVHFLDPEVRWNGSLSLGAGISHLDTCDTDEGCLPAAVQDFNVTELSFRGGMKLGYRPTDALNVFLEPAVYLVTVDRDDSRQFADVTPQVEMFDVLWLTPIQAGVSVRIN